MRYFFFIAVSFFSFSKQLKATADSSIYNIQFTVRGLKAPKAVLGYHFGDQNFVVDSMNVDTLTGSMRFATRQKLAEGVYFLAITEGAAKGILFDFILAGDRNFLIETDVNAPIDSANIDRSLENIEFFNYQKKARQVQTEINGIRSMLQMLQRATKDRAVLAEQEQKIAEKIKELDAFMAVQIQKYPDNYTTKLLKLLQKNCRSRIFTTVF